MRFRKSIRLCELFYSKLSRSVTSLEILESVDRDPGCSSYELK
jgi:hypothetical protein